MENCQWRDVPACVSKNALVQLALHVSVLLHLQSLTMNIQAHWWDEAFLEVAHAVPSIGLMACEILLQNQHIASEQYVTQINVWWAWASMGVGPGALGPRSIVG